MDSGARLARNRRARRKPTGWTGCLARLAALAALLPLQARASLFEGETLDAVANGASWVVLVIGPIIGIVLFWIVHILPEKIAEKKGHPQAKAIQSLCLLSLVFGGLLWPFALLWAMTKPVLHKVAYGHDYEEPHGAAATEPEAAKPRREALPVVTDEVPPRVRDEMQRLKEQLDRFEGGVPPTRDQVLDMRRRLAAIEAAEATTVVIERKG